MIDRDLIDVGILIPEDFDRKSCLANRRKFTLTAP